MPVVLLPWETGSIVFEYGILPDSDGIQYKQMITGVHFS